MAALCALVTIAVPATARADLGWSAPETVSSGGAMGSVVVGIDGKGVATIAWTTQGGVYAATRAPGGSVSKPQLIGSPPGWLHLAVAENGDAVLAWSDGGNGTTYASARRAGGVFSAPQVVHDPVVDAAIQPDVAIAPNGWAVVATPSGDFGSSFIAAIRPPGGVLGKPQAIWDPTRHVPYYVSTGIDPRGDAVVSYQIDDCPNLPPDYRCEHPIRVSVAQAGGTFPAPVAAGDGGEAIGAPNVAVGRDGHATIGFQACTDRNGCVDTSKVVDADLPAPFGPPRVLSNWTGPGYGHGEPVTQRPNVAVLRDGSSLAWLWTQDSPNVFYATRGSGGWSALRQLPGAKAHLLASRADDEGDVVFYGLTTMRPCDGDCMRMRVQRWDAGTAALGDPVTLSTAQINTSAVAPGPAHEIVAAWTEGLGADKLVVRAYEELRTPDTSAPVVALVSPPRAPAAMMRLRASCDERCTLAASGLLRVGSNAFAVTAPAQSLAAEKVATFRLRVRKRDLPGLRRALRRHGARTLETRLVARDRAGNRRVTSRRMRLR